MSLDKEKENGGVNSNFYNHSIHQMFNHVGTPYNTSPATSPSIGSFAMPLYGVNTVNGNNASTSATPYLARQLTYAQISRQSSSPHHHARAAAAMARNTPLSSTVTITDPNDPHKHVNGSRNKSTSEGEEGQVWTSLDMGGMGLKNIAPTICNYTFLTALYINHNSLTYLMPSLFKLSNLKTLDVSGNKLTMLPPELGLLTNLRELLLFDNNIVSLPTEFGNLYQLETLGLEGNPIHADLKNILIKEGTQALIISLRENAPVGLPPPQRDWLIVEADTVYDDPGRFTVLCYNTLCQKYATPQAYGYTPSWALNWDYRKELLVAEILGHNADILCLQEMEMGQYEDYFKEQFKKMGDYDSIFYPKTRAKTMSGSERRVVDGCATFFRASRFRLVDHDLIEYNQKAIQRPDFQKTPDIFNRVMNKDNIAVLAMLEDTSTHERVIVANSHIHWDPSDADVKLVQVGVLMDEIDGFAKKHLACTTNNSKSPAYNSADKVPLVICGDFNSAPDSGVYEFFSKGVIQQNHDDFGSHCYGSYTTEGLSHSFSLKSSYNSIQELPFTNYTPGFKGVLDYIWHSSNTLEVVSLLGAIDSEYLSKVVGFPNAHFPSDHIPLVTELRFKTLANKASFDYSTNKNTNRL